jgi:hypothetical protein
VYQDRIVADIKAANPDRTPHCIRRRLLKILEELGETSEAYLSRTGTGNYKNKSWDDYREEGVDTLIVMLDVALTELEGFNYPPSAFLALHINDGREAVVRTYEDMERIKFEVARAVCSADYFLRAENGESGFYGAMARGVKAAASLCYATIPNDARHIDLDEFIYGLVQIKLEKWKGRSTAKTPEEIANTKGYKVIEGDEVDAKTYFEELRDRQI